MSSPAVASPAWSDKSFAFRTPVTELEDPLSSPPTPAFASSSSLSEVGPVVVPDDERRMATGLSSSTSAVEKDGKGDVGDDEAASGDIPDSKTASKRDDSPNKQSPSPDKSKQLSTTSSPSEQAVAVFSSSSLSSKDETPKPVLEEAEKPLSQTPSPAKLPTEEQPTSSSSLASGSGTKTSTTLKRTSRKSSMARLPLLSSPLSSSSSSLAENSTSGIGDGEAGSLTSSSTASSGGGMSGIPSNAAAVLAASAVSTTSATTESQTGAALQAATVLGVPEGDVVPFASKKRNADFHALFPAVPLEELLVE
ncbi:hypothetical protein HK102_013920, partial [Quaeritorhiza haematococci]